MFRPSLSYCVSHLGIFIIRACQKPKFARIVLRCTLAVILVLTSASFLASVVVYQQTIRQKSTTETHLLSPKQFIIDTEGCKIPFIHPFDKSVLPYLLKPSSINCSLNIPSLTIQTIDKILLNREALSVYPQLSYCHYIPVVKPENGTTLYQLLVSKKVKFKYQADVNTDFLKVQCFTKDHKHLFEKYHAFAVPKPGTVRIKRSTADDGPPNVILIGIDSLSRNNFIRELPKTRRFVLNELGGVELLGYNKVDDNTFPNIIPLTLGVSVRQLRKILRWKQTMPFDKYDFIWKKYGQAGYLTMFSEDMPSYGTFDYMKKGFAKSPVDHFYNPMAAAAEAEPKLWRMKQCFGDKIESEIILNYVSDFVTIYKYEKHFAYVFLSRLFHETDKGVKEADDIFLKFLTDLYNKGNMENTVLILFSDHGSRFGTLRRSPVGRLEERLPAAYIVTPKDIKLDGTNVSAILRQNAGKLTTPYDIHETLLDILYQTKNRTLNSGNGISLFSEIPSYRDCRMAGISKHWCTCSLFKPLNVTSEMGLKIAQFLVDHINSLLSKHEKLCYKLHLQEIRSVGEWNITSRSRGMTTTSLIDKRDYVVDIKTLPGGGIFEATVLYRNGKLMIQDEISRLNPYRGLSDCVSVFPAKKLCYCKQNRRRRTIS